MDAAPDAMIVTDEGGTIVLANAQAERLFQYPGDELVGQPVEMLIPEAERDGHPSHRARYAATPVVREMGADLSLRARRKDGSTFPAGISLGPIVLEGRRFVSSAVRDLTAQMETQTTLRESEHLFRQMFEGADHGIVIASLDGHLLRVNRAFCDFLGRDEADLVGKHFLSITHPDDAESSDSVSQGLRMGERQTFGYHKRYVHAQGHAVWAHLSGSTVSDDQGSPLYVIGHAVDVTAEMAAKQALVQSEFIVANSSDLLALLDTDYRYVAANPAYLKAFGKTIDQVLGHTLPEVLGDELFAVLRPHIDRCLSGTPVADEAWLEFPGGKVYMDVHYQPHVSADNSIQGFIVRARDVTERFEAESKRANVSKRISVRRSEWIRSGRWPQESRTTSTIYWCPS